MSNAPASKTVTPVELVFASSGAPATADPATVDRDAPQNFTITREVLDALPEAMITCNADQQIVWANRTTAAVFGWEPEELRGLPLDVLLPAPIRKRHRRYVEEFLKSDLSTLCMSERSELVGLCRNRGEFAAEATILKSESGGVMFMTVIVRDVSQRKRAEQRLRDALEEATASSRGRSHFLATMSHELRTPLNAIIGFSELLERELHGPLGDDRYQSYAADIHASGTHLLEVVDSVLTSAKLETNRVEVNATWLSVNALMAEVARRMQPIISGNEQTLEVRCENDLELYADQLLCRQILINLLANASKFSPSGGTIKFEAMIRDNRLMIDVIDNGAGIPAGLLRNLGRPFFQAQQGFARAQGGVGLGLYIVRTYLGLHDAALAVDSAEGAGTTVSTCWPVCRVRIAGCPLTHRSDDLAACANCFNRRPRQYCNRVARSDLDGSLVRAGADVRALPLGG